MSNKLTGEAQATGLQHSLPAARLQTSGSPHQVPNRITWEPCDMCCCQAGVWFDWSGCCIVLEAAQMIWMDSLAENHCPKLMVPQWDLQSDLKWKMFLLPKFIISLLKYMKKIYLARECQQSGGYEIWEESRAGWYCLKQKGSRYPRMTSHLIWLTWEASCHTTVNIWILWENR